LRDIAFALFAATSPSDRDFDLYLVQ
jgi:hypothetical protein